MGVTKQLLKLWFTSDHSKSEWYIGKRIKDVDNLLLHITPTAEISRTPRSLDMHMKHYKASELRTFLLYYGPPLLAEFLAPKLFEHFLLLSSAIYKLLQDNITPYDIMIAEKQLQVFVARGTELYVASFAVCNVHQLLHLAQNVRELGPLWAHACFAFEDINGKLLKFIHGTNYVDSQVIRAVSLLQKLPEISKEMENCPNPTAFQLYKKLTKQEISRGNRHEIDTGVFALGAAKGRLGYLTGNREDVISRYLGYKPDKINVFLRVQRGSTMTSSAFYDRGLKNNNSTVKIGNSFYKLILYTQTIHQEKVENLAIVEKLGENIKDKRNPFVSHQTKKTKSQLLHICLVKKGNSNEIVVQLKETTDKWMILDLKDTSDVVYLTKPVNTKEKD